MHPMRSLFILLACILCCTSELYAPTDEEWQYAVLKSRPRDAWGYQARKERSLRLFCLGGSNTMWDQYFTSLHSYLTKHTQSHPTWNATVSRVGMSGVSLGNTVGMKMYAFERDPIELWPNVFMLEFAVNLLGEHFNTAQRDLDAIVNGINHKYEIMGLPAPDYMFFELFNVRYYIEAKNKDPAVGVEFLNKDIDPNFYQKWHGRDRGCAGCHLLREFANFYGYPTVSWRDAGFPAFVRYFVGSTQETFDKAPWNFTVECQHITRLTGHQVVHRLMAPFFELVMEPRAVEKPMEDRYPYGNVSLKLTTPVMNNFQIELYTIWDEENNSNLDYVMKKPIQWERLTRDRHRIDEKAYGQDACYGSHDAKAVLEIEFYTPSTCNVNECLVNLQFLHSWNTSLIGSVSCSLYHEKTALIKNMVINGNKDSRGVPMSITSLQKILFNTKLREGKHEIVCKKLDSKLSCVAAFDVSAQVLL